MKNYFYLFLTLLIVSCTNEQEQVSIIKNDLRPPAYPLLTLGPNLNAWSYTDTLYHSQVQHLQRGDLPLVGALRVDGQVYRFLGLDTIPSRPLIPISTDGEWQGRYSFLRPDKGWEKPGYDDAEWLQGKAAFGTREELNVHTIWPTKDIWVRREVSIDSSLIADNRLILKYSHDDVFRLYLNGIPFVQTPLEWHKNVEVPIPDSIAATFLNDKSVIAVHCSNDFGGGLVDFGLYTESKYPYLERTAIQTSVDVQATSTRYRFECGDVELTVTFTAPLLTDDLDLLSASINYITYEINSLDDREHEVSIYFEADPCWATTDPKRKSISETYEDSGMRYVRTGSKDQILLDRFREGWGYFLMGVGQDGSSTAIGDPAELRKQFAENGYAVGDSTRLENARMVVMQDLGKSASASGKVVLGYDDVYAIQYFGNTLRPYWNRTGDLTMEQVLARANAQYQAVMDKCRKFDCYLMVEARIAGGKEYAELCALAYRQVLGANKLVEAPNTDLLLIGRDPVVDVFFASTPLYLYYNPDLVKAFLNPTFYYHESGKWEKNYPPHNIGIYPMINRHQEGFNMPIDQAGSLMILLAAITQIEQNTEYVSGHWPVISTWGDYLTANAMDPRQQQSSDVFTAFLEDNANLSAKGIIGVASYAYLAGQMGDAVLSDSLNTKAKQMATEWMTRTDCGDHYAMAFHADTTWSQKYNLAWDKTLGLNVFPDSVAQKEFAYYLTKMNEYGVPLDSRESFSKADWISWSAVLADDKKTFMQFVGPLYRFMNETTSRIPMPDLIHTDTIVHRDYPGRPVVGAYFMRLLHDKIQTNKE